MTVLTFTKADIAGIRLDRPHHCTTGDVAVRVGLARRPAHAGVSAPARLSLLILMSREDRDRLARDGGTHDMDVAGQTIRLEVT